MHAGCWERLTLICPRCRAEQGLALEQTLHSAGDFVLEGLLHCSTSACLARYPILDGVPVVLKDISRWWQHASLPNTVADSVPLREYFASLEADAPAAHDRRRLLSTYMDAHYGTPPTPLAAAQQPDYWQQLIALTPPAQAYQQTLDLGCSVGRYTFELARQSELAVGLDLNFDLLAAAARIQREQTVRYERSLRGRFYTSVDDSYETPQNVLFLLADALDPPLRATDFDCVAALNLLDNVKVPLILIGQMDALLRPGGRLLIASPYEWRSDLTEPAEWLENADYDAATMVKAILTDNLFPQMQLNYRCIQEYAELPWFLRQHERAWRLYLVHVLSAQKG